MILDKFFFNFLYNSSFSAMKSNINTGIITTEISKQTNQLSKWEIILIDRHIEMVGKSAYNNLKEG